MDQGRGAAVSGGEIEPGSVAAVRAARTYAPALFVACLAVCEGLLLAASAGLGLSLSGWLALHLAILAGAVGVLVSGWTRIADFSPYLLALIATAFGGVIGAGLAVLALVRLAREKPSSEMLDAWYERIALSGDVDVVTNLYNTVAMGRGLQTSTTPPQVFERVMTHGSLEERQTALGLIARQFSTSYAPALRLALVSPEPVIRVQAAAVAVKVRAELKISFAAAIGRSHIDGLSPLDAGTLAVVLRGMALSGLLEDDDALRGEAAVVRLVRGVVAALDAGEPWGGEPDFECQTLVETEMLRDGRYAAFRTLRTSQAALGRRSTLVGPTNA
jgi:hypothetical protein